MMLRLTLLNRIRVVFQIRPIQVVTGVNSKLDEDTHILMWDFDGVSLSEVRNTIWAVMEAENLARCHIFKTRQCEDNYHVFCLQRFAWPDAVAIIAQTPRVDWTFFKFGVLRGYFTLRISPKDGEIPFFMETIHGYGKEDVNWSDLTSFVKYETMAGEWLPQHIKRAELW